MAIYTGTSSADYLEGGAEADFLYGLEGDDNILGMDGDDFLDGGTGNDTLSGGVGKDTFVVDAAGDVVTDVGGQETDLTDLVLSSVSYTLGYYLENLTLTGTGNINATGNTLNNVLRGNSGNNILSGDAGFDVLDGGAGDDTMSGGDADDLYYVDSTGDVVLEAAGRGTDKIMSSISLTIIANIEELTLIGTDNINATGNAQQDFLTGNSGNNILSGGDGRDYMFGQGGDDYLDGGLMGDWLYGNEGNDTYVVDGPLDQTWEVAGEGTDLVRSSIDFTLFANTENLTLTGTDQIDAFGNGLDNVLTGNSNQNVFRGDAGNDTLNGDAGDDIAEYMGSWFDYDVIGNTTSATVSGPEGTDTLTSIESLRFQGYLVSLDAAVNVAPIAVNDNNDGDAVIEAGLGFAGDATASSNVLYNDRDGNWRLGDTMVVSGISGMSGGTVGVAVVGTYGSLLINANGNYTYTLNNADADTQALVDGQLAADQFIYTVMDAHGATGSATLSIMI